MVVTLLCVLLGSWLGVQVKWIRDRHEALRTRFPKQNFSKYHADAPWIIRILGESGMLPRWSIIAKTDEQLEKAYELRRLFPETDVSIKDLRHQAARPPKKLTGDIKELRGMGDLDRYKPPR